MRAVARNPKKISFKVRFRQVLANLHPLFYSQIQQSSFMFNAVISITQYMKRMKSKT